MLTIGMDARYGVMARRRGIGVYVHQLLAAWREHPPDNMTCVAFTDERADPSVMAALASPRLRFVTLAARPFAVWEQWAWPKAVRQHHLDVVHGTANIAPPGVSCPVVLTLHDVIEWHRGRSFPAHLSPRHRLSRLYRMRAMANSARAAAAVITVSEHARQDIAATLAIDPARIRVIPLAASAPPAQVEANAAAKLGVAAPYAVALGALDERKNMRLLWQIFRDWHRLPLVVVGFEPEALAAARAEVSGLSHVTVAGFVSEAVRTGLVAQSQAFLYPSRYEGFGLPALEAMAAGVPTLVGAGTAAAEVTAGGALALNPTDPTVWRAALDRLLDDPEAARQLAEAGRQVARQYHWAATATATWDTYRRVAEA